MVILEGTDAVGKTSVIKLLKEYKLKDRDKNICKLFDFNISLLERVIKLKKYLDNNNNYVIILINNDRNELEKRVTKHKNLIERMYKVEEKVAILENDISDVKGAK